MNEDVVGGRTGGEWTNIAGHIEPTNSLGVNVLIKGINKYLNFNTVSGILGYGIRDNGGTIEYKDSGGSWVEFGAGSGDMLASVYDPTEVEGDAFDMDNMVEGTSKILTSAERTILSNTSNTNTGDNTVSGTLLDLTGDTLSINEGTLTDTKICTYEAGTGIQCTTEAGVGTVTSVAMTVPTGLSISGTPITAAGTLALIYTAGYAAVTTASTTDWNTFYKTPSDRIVDGTNLTWSENTLNAVDTTYLGGTGLTLAGTTFNVDTSQSITTLSNLTDNGFVKTTGGNGTLSIDTSTYLTTNESISLSGDISGTGATSITTTIGADKILESMLKSVNTPTDEYVLTYEATTGDFEWQADSEGGNVSNTGTPVDNQIAVWTDATTIEGTTGLTYDGTNLLLTGDIGSTGSRITKGWFADLTVTNAISGAVTGNAGTVTTITGLAPDTATTQSTQANITSLGTLTGLTVGGTTNFDDGVGNSPVSYWIDADDKYLAIAKKDAGEATLENDEGAIHFLTSGDVNDYLKVSTAAGIVTLETQAGDNGDLVIKSGGGEISFDNENLTTTGKIGLTGTRVLEGWFTDLESTNDITISGSTLASIYSPIAGSSSIVTVGTIGTGVWQGTAVDIGTYTNLVGGTGITLTDDTLSVDVSQNITTLSNLTDNGFVKTSGGNGTLSVDTSTYLTEVPTSTKCIVIENLAAADDNMSLGSLFNAVTIYDVWCTYAGTGTTVAQITLEDGAGNAMTHTAPTCTAQATVPTEQKITAGGALTAKELLVFDVDNAVAPETDTYTLCVSYK